jgi:hypothetical protein
MLPGNAVSGLFTKSSTLGSRKCDSEIAKTIPEIAAAFN